MDFVILETFDNYIDANLMLGRFEEAGINCWLKDEQTATLNLILTNAIGGIKLMVAEDDVTEATEILNALKEIKRKSFACPECGSQIVLKNHRLYFTNNNRPDAAINLYGKDYMQSNDDMDNIVILRKKNSNIFGFELSDGSTEHLRLNKTN